MKLLKTLGSALCLVSLFITLSSKAQTLEPGQTYTTGNIVQNTPYGGPTPWVGGVYQDQLSCWSYGDPGYCGPNAIVRPGNAINFSYGSTYLYQQQAMASVLPSATGLQVSGFNFGFTAKNGNGWDGGRLDSLTALVRFWDPTGGRGATNIVEKYEYNLNYQFNWTSFNYSENFTTPHAATSIGQVQYGFLGRDNNGWAGPYGPEITNVSFSLKYSVDPCMSNIMSSPSCPGYYDAIAKLATPTTSATVDPIVAVAPTASAPSPPAPAPAQPPPSEAAAPPPPPPPSSPSGAPTPTQQTVAQAPPGPAQAKVGEVTDSAGGSSKPTVSLSSVLSMISANQEKTAALERSVVQAADAQAFSAGESAKQTAEKVAGEAQSQSIALSNSQVANATQSASALAFSSPMQSTALALQGNLASNTTFSSKADQSSFSSSSTTSVFGSTDIQRSSAAASALESSAPPPQVAAYTPRTAKAMGSEAPVFADTSYTPPKADYTSLENVMVQSGVYVPKNTTTTSSDTSTASGSTYQPAKSEAVVADTSNTQISVYAPPKAETTASDNNVGQTSAYIYKAPAISTVDMVEPQGTTTTIFIGRALPEVKQEVTYTGPTMMQQPSRYEPPKAEVNFAPTVNQGIQYQPPVTRQDVVVAMVTPQTSYNLVTPNKPLQVQVETPTLEGIKFGHRGPVDNGMEAKPFVIQTNTSGQQTETVKKNVQNNEAAGNVTIESIAKQPTNYAQYFTALPDTAFYAPKDIYKNQKTIDNARALRSLSSDALHQRMIDSQYK